MYVWDASSTPIKQLGFYIQASNNMQLQWFDRGDLDSDTLLVHDETDNSNRLECSYFPEGVDNWGLDVLFCGYNSTATLNTANQNVSVITQNGFYFNPNNPGGYGSAVGYNQPNVFSKWMLYVGDVNCDGSVNAIDSTMVLQYATNHSGLNYNQRLAADVTRNGVIDAEDSMQILKYATDRILSFWNTNSIVGLPSNPAPELISDHYYYLRNVTTGQYLYFNQNGTSAQFAGENNNSSGYTRTFKLSSGSYFAFQHVGSNGYLQINSNGSVICSPGLTNSSVFWCLSPASNGSYRMTNYTNKHCLLNSGFAPLSFDRCLYASEWEIVPVGFDLRYYYDYGYKKRMNNSITSLRQAQSNITDIIETLFGVTITVHVPEVFESYADLCYGGANNVSASEIVDSNMCTHTTPESCAQHCDNPDFTATPPQVHHRSDMASLHYLSNATSNLNGIKVLTSGYRSCSINRETSPPTHGIGLAAGVSNLQEGVASVFHGDNSNSDVANSLIALHEISHQLGANRSTTCPADTEHGNCVMSYNHNSGMLQSYFNTPSQYRSLYCNNCYNAILNYVRNH